MRTFLAALGAAFLLSASPAWSAACLPTKTVRDLLTKGHGERPLVIGITGSGSVMVLYANPKTRSWSVVVHSRNGLGCLIQSGGGLRIRNLKPKGKPA